MLDVLAALREYNVAIHKAVMSEHRDARSFAYRRTVCAAGRALGFSLEIIGRGIGRDYTTVFSACERFKGVQTGVRASPIGAAREAELFRYLIHRSAELAAEKVVAIERFRKAAA